jgi:hypothetical protein
MDISSDVVTEKELAVTSASAPAIPASAPAPAPVVPKPEIVIPVEEYKSFYQSQQPPVEPVPMTIAYFEGVCNTVSLPLASVESIVDSLVSNGVVDSSSVLFVDGTVVSSNCMLPPAKIKDYQLIHWFLVERVSAPAAASAVVETMKQSQPARKRAKKSPEGCYPCATEPAVSAPDSSSSAPDSSTAPAAPEEPVVATDAAAVVGVVEASSSSSSSRIVYPSSETSSVVGISQNKPYGYTRYNVIGVYACPTSSSASENVLSCYGSNVIDVPQGRNATRCILDHISLYCRSTGGRVLVRFDDGSGKSVSYSGWAQIPLIHTLAADGSADYGVKTINMTQVRRALHGYVARNGVLKMDAYLQRHKSLAQAKKALTQWARYAEHNVEKALKVWTACSTNPDSCLFGWPQPMPDGVNLKYENLAFTDVYKLIRSTVMKRAAAAAANGGGGGVSVDHEKENNEDADDSMAEPSSDATTLPPKTSSSKKASAATAVSTPHIPKSSRLSRQRNKSAAPADAAAAVGAAEGPGQSGDKAKKTKRVPTPSQMATILKPVPISQGLIDFISIHCGEADKLKDGNAIDRPTFHQVLWRYIHANNLQPAKGSFVFPNEVLKQIFQIPPNEPQDKVKTFTMSRYLEWNFLGTKKRKRQEEQGGAGQEEIAEKKD